MSIAIEILRFRESEFNDLEVNEDTDTNYDLTEADLHVVKREIYEGECDPNLRHTSIRLLTKNSNTIASGLIINSL